MTNIKTILVVLFAAIVVVIGLTFVKKPATAPTQSTQTVEDLNSDLQSLDATDLDTGTDSQLDKLSSDSSSF